MTILDHPPDVDVREDALVQALDARLEEVFAPERAQETARLVVASDAAARDARERPQNARQ